MNNVRRLRGQFEMPQKELAAKIGISRAALNLIETGKATGIREKNVNKMCEIFNVSPVMLLADENFKFRPKNTEEIDYMIKVLEKMRG